MDYVVGSVAALVSGNVTPNRPRKFKKALTPTKHQPSPNVTPKSEFVEDRSIFLSPTTQKKKAIVKKSPKRIFQNPDLDVSNEDAGGSTVTSPKAVKVKKHLKDELDGTVVSTNEVPLSTKSPKSQEKVNEQNAMSNENEHTPKKKKKQRKSLIDNEDVPVEDNNTKENDDEKENITENIDSLNTTPKKKKKKRSKSVADTEIEQETIESNEAPDINDESEKKKNKKKKKKTQKDISPPIESPPASDEIDIENPKKKNKKKKKLQTEVESTDNVEVNPNAVTNKDTDSEHESDDEMESENEEINKKALDPGPAAESSDEEEQKPKKEVPKKEETKATEDEVKRTIFVGNVPFSTKCKKEIKKIFNQYGQIETVRIRTVPVKDARVTPKMAVIKNELHPDRSTVNVYVKFADASSVEKALTANNTVLKDHHLRVSRSDTTGAAHDPKCSVFVGNVPFAIEDETLRAKFEKCGEIESVRIVRDKKTNAGRGFGYINFASKDGVELALALTEEDLTIKNRIMRVKRCTQVTQKKISRPENRQNQRQTQNQASYGRQNVGNQRGRFNGNGRDDKTEGAHRRVMNKRKNQDSGEAPPSKRPNLHQPQRDKKPRKEFVGVTAEKRKKHKFNKGQKKKKILSEILTKK